MLRTNTPSAINIACTEWSKWYSIEQVYHGVTCKMFGLFKRQDMSKNVRVCVSSVIVAYALVITCNTAAAVSSLTVAFLLTGQVDVLGTGDISAKTAAEVLVVVSSAVAGVARLGDRTTLERDWTLDERQFLVIIGTC